MSGAPLKGVVVGPSGVGKTSLLVRWADGHFRDDLCPTVQVEFHAGSVSVNGKPTKLNVWDTAGAEQYNSLTKAYLRGALVAVLVFSLAERSSFAKVDYWHQMILNTSKARVVLVGNKCDLDGREVPGYEAAGWAERLGVPYVETSAKTGDDVGVLFETVARAGVDLQKSQAPDSGVVAVAPAEAEDAGCC